MTPLFLRKLLWTALAAALAGSTFAPAADGGETWMYAPSYFSHHVPPAFAMYHPLPPRRAAHRTAWTNDRPGFGVESVVRVNRVQIRGGGGSVDTTVLYGARTRFGR